MRQLFSRDKKCSKQKCVFDDVFGIDALGSSMERLFALNIFVSLPALPIRRAAILNSKTFLPWLFETGQT